MRCQGPRGDVKYTGKPLSRDRVEHLLHQNQTLARREIRHTSPGQGESLAARRRGVLGLQQLGQIEDEDLREFVRDQFTETTK